MTKTGKKIKSKPVSNTENLYQVTPEKANKTITELSKIKGLKLKKSAEMTLNKFPTAKTVLILVKSGEGSRKI